MPGRILAASLMLGLIGCLPETAQLALVPSDNAEIQRLAAKPIQRSPATEAVAKRVIGISQKLLASNRGLGIRPSITTLGVPHEELFHRGSEEIYISEGLVNKCKSDDQIAALLALEMGRIVAEREVIGGTVVVGQPMPRDLPEDIPVGNDSGGWFGPPDGTRMMELARLEKAAKTPRSLPEPESLARQYLRRSGYAESEIRATEYLARLADSNSKLARQMLQR